MQDYLGKADANIVRRWDERDVNELHENPRQMRRHLGGGACSEMRTLRPRGHPRVHRLSKTASARGTADATVPASATNLSVAPSNFSECASSLPGR